MDYLLSAREFLPKASVARNWRIQFAIQNFNNFYYLTSFISSCFELRDKLVSGIINLTDG